MKKKLTNKHNGAVLIVEENVIREIKDVKIVGWEMANARSNIKDGKWVVEGNELYYPRDWELSDYDEKPTLYYIRGVKDRGNEVIKMLEDRGGKNSCYLFGDCACGMYFIDSNNVIQLTSTSLLIEVLGRYGTELHLPEKDADNEIKKVK